MFHHLVFAVAPCWKRCVRDMEGFEIYKGWFLLNLTFSFPIISTTAKTWNYLKPVISPKVVSLVITVERA